MAKIKIIMDSGRDYTSERDNSFEEFALRLKKTATGASQSYLAVDKEANKLINVNHISEIITENN